ncbi:MAG: hypothetical protein PHE68_03915 [Candidatus Peribacteraceae bacterium]|nr:hypothetical protein [Candidatus Peribacteraceae bacterium]MDD5075187.1 hypothetical protein [Candidatus Peribacteraceae bacterium]
MIDFKKRGTFLRIDRLCRTGRRYPDYGLKLMYAPLRRRLFERVLGCVFTICSRPWTRALADRIPDGVMGPLFVRLRAIWKRSTRRTKRTGVSAIALAITD